MVESVEQSPEPAETNITRYTFAFRFWAVLILVAAIWQFFQPMIIGRVGTIPPGLRPVSYGLGLIGFVCAAGFWQGRRWGLWLFMILVGLFFLQNIVLAVTEIVTTGGVASMGQRLFGLIVGPLLLTFLYNQRKYFK